MQIKASKAKIVVSGDYTPDNMNGTILLQKGNVEWGKNLVMTTMDVVNLLYLGMGVSLHMPSGTLEGTLSHKQHESNNTSILHLTNVTFTGSAHCAIQGESGFGRFYFTHSAVVATSAQPKNREFIHWNEYQIVHRLAGKKVDELLSEWQEKNQDTREEWYWWLDSADVRETKRLAMKQLFADSHFNVSELTSSLWQEIKRRLKERK